MCLVSDSIALREFDKVFCRQLHCERASVFVVRYVKETN